jgi:hypothetical protein
VVCEDVGLSCRFDGWSSILCGVLSASLLYRQDAPGNATVSCVNLECGVADGLIVSTSGTRLDVTLTDVDATVKRRVWVATESNCDAEGGGFESYFSVLNDHFDSEGEVYRVSGIGLPLAVPSDVSPLQYVGPVGALAPPVLVDHGDFHVHHPRPAQNPRRGRDCRAEDLYTPPRAILL